MKKKKNNKISLKIEAITLLDEYYDILHDSSDGFRYRSDLEAWLDRVCYWLAKWREAKKD